MLARRKGAGSRWGCGLPEVPAAPRKHPEPHGSNDDRANLHLGHDIQARHPDARQMRCDLFCPWPIDHYHFGASADAATAHRFKPPAGLLRAGHLRPAPRVTVPKGYAVPGWTDEETRKWLYNGSAASGLG